MQPLVKKTLPFFLFAMALAAGFFTRPVSGHSNLSSIYDLNLQSWDEIACLPKAENESLYKTLHLKPQVNPDDCTSAIDGRFNKVLAFLSKNKLDLPGDSMGELTDLIRNPIAFISENVPELDFDFNQEDSIASNAMQSTVYLGGDFFRVDPYVAVGVLMHEAWHSLKIDPGHERCTSGDIAQNKGGCDEAFALNGNMIGGYSVAFAYFAAHGLYSKTLSLPKKQQLVNEALTLLATRFNTGVQKFASITESLIVLNKNQDVEMVHPLLMKTKMIAAHSNALKPVKIEYNQRNGGVLILTADHKLYEWSAYTPLQRFYAAYLTDEFKVIDAARLYLGADDTSYTSVLLEDHRIFKYGPQGPGQEWAFSQALDLTKSPELQPMQIATYDLRSAGFLDKTGDVYRFGQNSRGTRPYMLDDALMRFGIKFKFITGGVNTDAFWGISVTGDVYYRVKNELVKLALAPQARIKKVQTTILGVYLLTDSGQVFYNAHSNIGAREFTQLNLRDVQDIVIVKRMIAQDKTYEDVTETTACTGKPLTQDPYFAGFVWTLDSGRLYFGDGKVCSWVSDKVRDFSFIHPKTGDFSEFRAFMKKEDNTSLELPVWQPLPFR